MTTITFFELRDDDNLYQNLDQILKNANEAVQEYKSISTVI